MKGKTLVALLMTLGALAPLATQAATGSPYPSSALGYDVSFATTAYPAETFNFAIVSVTRGKSFVNNPRFASEFLWAKFGSAAAPTIYMNLNAPYGKTVAGHISSPKSCAPRDSATSTEPSPCEGYNYGYNAAQDAYAYARGKSAEASVWWLDVEEENSWSKNVSVNDSVIQGAVDLLSAQGVRVGVYSTPRMWRDIAGTGFAPVQVNKYGTVVSTPVWYPVGIKSFVGAINTCNSAKSFIPNNPIWLIQYETSSTAIDQNLAC